MYKRPKKKNKKKIVLFGIIVLLLCAIGYFVSIKFEWEKPSFYIIPELHILGRQTAFRVVCEDRRSGIKSLRIEINQGDLVISLFQKNYPPGIHHTEESVEAAPVSLGLKDGAALLRAKVRDYSWIPGGNIRKEEIEVVIDTRPPNINVLIQFHYLNQGGAGLIIYRASEKLARTGINAKTMAHFADRRDYIYRGRKIDFQYHLGVDLASLTQSPVKAANHGKVVFAEELGIYGNTVILDHGFGLFSMYGHLSQIDVQVDQIVEKGTHMGITGRTGLAGGDHLHFAVLVSGIFVNPIEWWDPRWIKDNVENKLALLRDAEN